MDLIYNSTPCNPAQLQKELVAGGFGIGVRIYGVSFVDPDTIVHGFSDLTAQEQTDIGLIVAAHVPTSPAPHLPLHVEEVYTTGKLTRRTWYADGELTQKVREEAFTYVGNALTQNTETTWDAFGNVLEAITWNYVTSIVGGVETRQKTRA